MYCISLKRNILPNSHCRVMYLYIIHKSDFRNGFCFLGRGQGHSPMLRVRGSGHRCSLGIRTSEGAMSSFGWLNNALKGQWV